MSISNDCWFYKMPIGNVKKLEPTFLNKKYVLHYENLQLYLRLGLKLNDLVSTLIDNDLAVRLKSKIKLVFNKPEYVCMCILDMNEVLICEFH